MTELQNTPPNFSEVAPANSECLYKQGVVHVSNYLGQTEPKFEHFFDSETEKAWFRQPLTLIEIISLDKNLSLIQRKQTGSANAFGQGDDLIIFLKKNPCN